MRFASAGAPPIDIDCSKDELDMLAALDGLSSAVNANDVRVLYSLARHSAAVGDIVELGSDQGKSTIALSWGASRSERPCLVHAVDPFPDGEVLTSVQRVRSFEKHLKRFAAGNIKLHQMPSGDYRRERQEPVRLLFVDAAHDYLNSRYDFLAWRELISPGGFLVAHDVDNYLFGPGTRKAFTDCVLSDPRFRLVFHADNIAVAQMVGG